MRDSANRRDTGVSVEFLDELVKRTHCKFTSSPLNRSRLLIELKAHRVDLVVMTVKNPTFDRAAKSIKIESIPREMLISSSLKNKIKSIEGAINDPSIRFLVLPAVTIYFTPEETEKLQREQRFVTAPTIQNTFQLLKRTKNLAVIHTDFVNQYFQNTLDMKSDFIRIADQSKNYDIVIYYRSSIRSEDLAAITQAVNEVVADGTWKKIKDKYANFKNTL
ncbi:transporter substrate-binding domain-containing protein [Bdellovibrio sp. KM01]|nr:transporter substrate-binding domain-containing protein [Bdellovibrio sp. KM01]